LEDSRPIPFKVIKEGNRWKPNILNIIRYTKIRYQEWLFAGGEDSGEEFFVDLCYPKAVESIEDPTKDTHPRAQLLRDWEKAKEEYKEWEESLKGRGMTIGLTTVEALSLGLVNHDLVSCCFSLCLFLGLYFCLQTLDCVTTK